MAEGNLSEQSYVLGIDLGSASLGWAAIGLGPTGLVTGLLRAGVRLFDPAVTGDIQKGQDECNAVARTDAPVLSGIKAHIRAGVLDDVHGI